MYFRRFQIVFQVMMKNMEFEDIDRELDYFLGNVTEKTCQLCHRKDKCWTKNFTTTYDYMKQIMLEMEQRDEGVSQKLYRDFETYCIKPKR